MYVTGISRGWGRENQWGTSYMPGVVSASVHSSFFFLNNTEDLFNADMVVGREQKQDSPPIIEFSDWWERQELSK